VNILTLSSTKGLVEEDGQWTSWSHARNEGDDGYYEQVRGFILWYSTIVLAISCVLDTIDTYDYYINGKREIDRRTAPLRATGS
jgi:hypothetical protein